MSTLVDLLAEHTALSDAAAGHLQRLVAEWQLLADLSFADGMLTVRGDNGAMVTVAQCRPNTASTVFPRRRGWAESSTAPPTIRVGQGVRRRADPSGRIPTWHRGSRHPAGR